MNKRRLSFYIVLLIVSFMSCGVIAYFTTESTIRGTITSGSLKLKIHQIDSSGNEITNNELGILPGDKFDRSVSVENIGNQDMFLRVKLITLIDDENLNPDNCINVDIYNEYWQYKEGYYYYYKKLKPGQISEKLFSQITISGKDVDNKYLGKTLFFDVVAQATQAKNNSDSAINAQGWPA